MCTQSVSEIGVSFVRVAILSSIAVREREVFREVCMIGQQCELSSVNICFVWSVNARSEVCGGRID